MRSTRSNKKPAFLTHDPNRCFAEPIPNYLTKKGAPVRHDIRDKFQPFRQQLSVRQRCKLCELPLSANILPHTCQVLGAISVKAAAVPEVPCKYRATRATTLISIY
uniref:Uncharacterized protein n=1 Tax=Anopheles culicifacies TaxID=139723 RepID=A0A182M2C7_9DIPT